MISLLDPEYNAHNNRKQTENTQINIYLIVEVYIGKNTEIFIHKAFIGEVNIGLKFRSEKDLSEAELEETAGCEEHHPWYLLSRVIRVAIGIV